MKTSIYDTPVFFERYLKLRQNPISLNEVVEKPTMFSLLPDLTNKKVLDLGCGTGEHLLTYLQLGAREVVGIDLSQSMLKQAKNTVENHWKNQTTCRLYALPMEQLSQLVETHFDLITSSFAFHYIADFPQLLTDISTKLTPNGRLIFSQEHPIVTAHKQGDRWEKNAQKQQIAYRLNHYREEGIRERNWFKQSFKTYHRTTATIINQLISTGFAIEQIAEPMLTEQTQWHNEFKDLLHRPPLLFVRSVKK
ncbi:ubiquinone/menaquinone biosynthesis C-methylase UbiE [Nicoletella semolina]|uniref:Ubiquinone/menaquinone biosynthesis C-methylase UbiE n=1 Tax=Nicoletella semolina TaxID=271160 RepID=A0A4R2N6J4_9PAST|nr:class I SAM-dependent methyltransferase [Nicoletella semolina]MDH2925185.1 hypothetical protein [Nicoletella semolina]TCP16504.1 ubiquinone/menaquinone biosynthesis C-methylase UbiE [Nicoletella semolina]